jgi:hypothetical protein
MLGELGMEDDSARALELLFKLSLEETIHG